MHPSLSRRSLLVVGGATATAGLLAACGGGPARATPEKAPSGVVRKYYGDDRDNQFGDLYLPKRTPVGTAVLVHGGFWLAEYGADLMNPMAQVLVDDGWAVWNLEYRRLGGGGGWPATFQDVAAGVDHLRGLDGVDLDRVVVVGHSAGGHLAAWAGSRTPASPGGAPEVEVRGVVSLAGVLDLHDGSRQGLGGGVIDQLLGGTPLEVPARYRNGDPSLMVPAGCPVAVLHGTDDEVVPLDQATAYVAAAKAAGGEARLTEVPGDHMAVIDPSADSWPTIAKIMRQQAG